MSCEEGGNFRRHFSKTTDTLRKDQRHTENAHNGQTTNGRAQGRRGGGGLAAPLCYHVGGLLVASHRVVPAVQEASFCPNKRPIQTYVWLTGQLFFIFEASAARGSSHPGRSLPSNLGQFQDANPGPSESSNPGLFQASNLGRFQASNPRRSGGANWVRQVKG